MYAPVDIKGKQYKAETGALLKVDLFDNNAGDLLEFASVMLVSGEQGTKVGQPYLPGITVKAVVQEHGRNRKIRVFKYKKRKNYRRTRGHRQSFTAVRIDAVQA